MADARQKENQKEKPPISYRYIITSPKGDKKEFVIRLHSKTLELIQEKKGPYPDWTALKHQKCSNCPLHEAEHPQCPAAVSIVDVMEEYGAATSYDEVQVRVESEDRVIEQKVPLQKALSSIIGLRMATSGCPILKKLRPMARHHLPFAGLYETRYRVMSMYLLGQWILAQNGKEADWKLKGLEETYKQIQEVNRDFKRRLLTPSQGDAGLNAIVILNAFADGVTFTIDLDMVDELEQLFQAALE
ncbi:MAG: hypothetical protein HY594_02210 [Candidatus Omnitrophica bacterium]|nr:hypothetical protein [Candidatus Omnitrophota bacterium]